MKKRNILIVAVVILMSLVPIFIAAKQERIGSRADAFVGPFILMLGHFPLQILCSVYGGLHLKEMWFLPLIPCYIAILLEGVWKISASSVWPVTLLLTAPFVVIMLIIGLVRRQRSKKQQSYTSYQY